MLSNRALTAIAVFSGMLIGVAAWKFDRLVDAGAPPPDSYRLTRGVNVERPTGCGPVAGGTRLRPLSEFDLIVPRAGGDTVILPRSNHSIIFDSASPTGLNRHDRLILQDRRPAETEFIRVGPHLLICSDDPRSEVLVLRHYCRGEQFDEPWNNGFEEIKFPKAREIWLRDDILADLLAMPNASTPGSEEFEDELLLITSLSLDRWTLRPFSDVLPGDWLWSIQCRRDGRDRLQNG